jgi:hypothetical protein
MPTRMGGGVELEPSCVDTHKRGEMLSAVSAPSIAEGTTGVEPASRAEKAAAVRPEALDPGRMAKQGARPFEVARWCRLMMLEQFHMPLAEGFGVRGEACGREGERARL